MTNKLINKYLNTHLPLPGYRTVLSGDLAVSRNFLDGVCYISDGDHCVEINIGSSGGMNKVWSYRWDTGEPSTVLAENWTLVV